ncbi:MAG: replication-associated recombination protein A [bacterium]
MPSDLFDSKAPLFQPLAERMRPTGVDEVLGQDKLLGPGSPLREAFLKGEAGSLIFWGPPGVGKTSLARLLAKSGGFHFISLSAVDATLKDARAVIEAAHERRRLEDRRTLLFLDEIHRFNKAQQDAFLPSLENGTLTLVGATTENPSFALNAALLSRSRVLRLEALSAEALLDLLKRALNDTQRGLGALHLNVGEGALNAIAQASGGDARRALGLLEQAAGLAQGKDGALDLDTVARVLGSKVLLYDKSGDQHYDIISALHKSVRSSDPDAAVYWCGRMLQAGEDPLYVLRRLTRMASEDIGNADPAALGLARAAREAYEFLGSPEGELSIIQLAAYLACVPKSDAVTQAWGRVKAEIEHSGSLPVPLHLRNAPTKLMKELGYGQGYVHAHDAPDAIADMRCLPEGMSPEALYVPTPRGREKIFQDYLAWVAQKKRSKS